MVARPKEKQPEAVRNSDLDIQKLENVAMESLDSWFGDEEHPENILKKVILKEIFEVAKAEERFQKDERSSSAEIPDNNFEKSAGLAKEVVGVSKLGKEYPDLDSPLQEKTLSRS
jgi:hypothetical protein